jgi:hypothetical protein
MNITYLPVIFANPVTAAISVPVGILAWVYIKNYPLYLTLLKEKIDWYNNTVVAAKTGNSGAGAGAGAAFKDAKKWSKNITQADLESDKHMHKTGFAYLNAIFFDRHSKYFKKKIFTRHLVFLTLPAAAIIFSLYGVITSQSPAVLVENIELEFLFSFTPIFFFIIYIASMGRTVTASVFSNCDIHMLHYPYYRIRETILASFKARFIFILKYNFIVTAVMSCSVISAIWLIYGYMDYIYAGIFFALLTVIGVFFAFNDLFLYYVIQPYDSAGKGKSIVYSIINVVIYIIAYLNMNTFRSDLILYSIIIVIATVLYIAIGLALLLSLAPKNFKLR